MKTKSPSPVVQTLSGRMMGKKCKFGWSLQTLDSSSYNRALLSRMPVSPRSRLVCSDWFVHGSSVSPLSFWSETLSGFAWLWFCARRSLLFRDDKHTYRWQVQNPFKFARRNVWMAADRVRNGYSRFLGLRVSVLMFVRRFAGSDTWKISNLKRILNLTHRASSGLRNN